MNGRFLHSGSSAPSFPLRLPPWSAGKTTGAWQTLAALAASCLLHSAILILPYFGGPAPGNRFLVKGAQRSPSIINATLVSAGKHEISAEIVSAEGERVPHPPASDRAAGDRLRPQENPSAGPGLLPIPAPAYYSTDQLTKRPQPLARAELDPPEIRAIVASGKIILKLWITERGEVAEVDVENSELPPAFSRAAVAAFKRLRFLPGERNGRPVGTVLRIEVNYDDGRAPPR